MMQQNTNGELNGVKKIYDLIIVGGGPAGASAAVYAARKRLKTALILKEWGGQSVVSDDVQNWIGTPHIRGNDLAKSFKSHAEEYKGDYLDIVTGYNVVSSRIEHNLKVVVNEKDEEFTARALLIASGSVRRRLDVPGATEYDHKGLTYCATCDGPLYAGSEVVVVGGGNAGFESAAQLLAYCSKVTLLSRGEPRADEITVEKLKSNSKFELITNAIPVEIHGNKMLTGISYKDKDGEIIRLDVEGVFVEVGQIPATEWCKEITELDQFGKVKIDPWTQKASGTDLIWSAGDCTNILYHQNNIAAGDAVRALEDIYKTLHA
jgi:NADH-dependent peroxiredoxin subunit F